MKKQKWISLFFTACLFVTLLCGCGKDNASSAPKSAASNNDTPTIGNASNIPKTESQTSSNSSSASPPIDVQSLDRKAQGWGQGTQVDQSNRPISCDQFQAKYGKYDAYFIGNADEKSITLSFDHGYENGFTPRILDTLKEKNCKALFFVTYDYVSKNPQLVQRMIDEGHIVGNHGYKHKSQPNITLDEAKAEITKLHDYVKETFGYEMTYFRPPMGEFSEQTLALTQSLGYKSVFWSFAYKDWLVDAQMGVDKAFPKVTGAIHNGAIYLLHPVSSDNAQMLGDVIDFFIQQGYQVNNQNIT